jgi:hypothetical protein
MGSLERSGAMFFDITSGKGIAAGDQQRQGQPGTFPLATSRTFRRHRRENHASRLALEVKKCCGFGRGQSRSIAPLIGSIPLSMNRGSSRIVAHKKYRRGSDRDGRAGIPLEEIAQVIDFHDNPT